jgi:glycosyltransferase involved in cell wall biosynthesis
MKGRENLKVASEAFIQAHGFSRPFMLVLGRKAGGKNYRLAIEALAQLNRKNYAIDLVMIGPDDDGVIIDIPNVYYLGMQPREVVIGALAHCLCVINMSSSESFGIVLIESWLAGRPVIVQRNCAAFAELVHDGKNGFLVETPEEIVESVIQYLSEPDYAKQCGKAGLEIAKSYTWFSLAETINNHLFSLANKEVKYE